MAAGLGFKDFTTGEVLTAADVDGYLMQGVWVFASATARDAAVTSPQEGNFAYLKDTNVTTYYTGSAWANLDTTGMTNPMTTTGDTIYSSSGSTPARLGIGTAGQVLQVNSGATAPEWATPAGGASGMTLIQRSTFSNVAGTSTTFDGVFTSTYVSYLIAIENCYSSTPTDDLQFVFRVSGSDAGGQHYGNLLQNTYNAATFVSTSSNAVNQLTINGSQSATYPFVGQINVSYVGTSLLPAINGMGVEEDNTKLSLFYGYYASAITCTGFRLKSASTNITGTVAVYGLAK
jgi:hypothetical protein